MNTDRPKLRQNKLPQFNGLFVIASASGLLAWNCVAAASSAETNHTLTLSQRLQHQHLEAVHQARLRLEAERHPVFEHGVYQDFRAVFQTVAENQSDGTRQELLTAARKNGIRILFLTESGAPKANAWRGLHEEVLFIPGSAAKEGVLWFPDYGQDGKAIPDTGLAFLGDFGWSDKAVSERMTGIQICNRNADPKSDQELRAYLSKATRDLNHWRALVSDYRTFRDEFCGAVATCYHPEVFAQWDKELQQKHLTGIGANDAKEIVMAGITFDPLEVTFRSLVTHILAEELTEPLIRQALTNGHAYVAHDWLCDPTGFSFGAMNNLGVFSMGDSAPMQGTTRVMAVTPVPAKLRLIHNGSVVQEATGTNLTFRAEEPGPYRLEAWLAMDGEDHPWIYSNPVYLRKLGPGDMRLPSSTLSPEVEPHKNITYMEGAEEDSGKHKLDVYGIKDKTNAPVFFFIHGGAWRSGDRSLYPALGNRFAKAGFVVVVPSYRLAPKHPHPAQIEDVSAAFAWTVRHVAEYGGDPKRIYVAGHSAGGHLAALLTLDERYLAAHQLSPSVIRGVLALSGVYNLTIGETQEAVFGSDRTARREASPLFHVHAGTPPFLVAYCQWDYFSLPAQARIFCRALQQAGAKAELAYVPGESHISEMVNIWREDCPLAVAALKFLKQ